MSKPTDKSNGKPANDAVDKSSGHSAGDRRFWRALQQDIPTQHLNPGKDPDSSPRAGNPAQPRLIDLTGDLSELSVKERETRRQALRSMLATSEARQQQVLRSRLPTFTPGLVVLVRSGPFAQCQGTVVDADYIHSRVLLDFSGESGAHRGSPEEAHWVEFARIAPVIRDEVAESSADADPTIDNDPHSGS